jgi:carboxyl-terminal processing protease
MMFIKYLPFILLRYKLRPMKLRTLFKSLIVPGLIFTLTAQASSGDKDYWKDTGLKIQNFKSDVLPTCNNSTATLLGCLDALNGLAGILRSPLVYATAQEKTDGNADLGDLVEEGKDGLNLYKLNGAPHDFLIVYTNHSKHDKQSHFAGTHELYVRTIVANQKVDFATRFDTMLAQVALVSDSLKDEEGDYASELYNLFFASAFDPHTYLITTKELSDEVNDPDEKLSGIGFEYYPKTEDGVIVSNVRENSPALLAGIRRRDQVLSVNGNATTNLHPDQVQTVVMNAEGIKVHGVQQPVVFMIKRGNSTFPVSITPAPYVVPNVSAHIFSDLGQPYGYIKIRSFDDRSADSKVADMVKDFEAKHVKGIILDLRQNRGGILGQAANIASVFVGNDKTIVTVKELADDKATTQAGSYPQLTRLPMVTLVDGDSASGSEILSGALQDYKRSWLVGDRTFGKGTAQGVNEYFGSPSYPVTGKIKIARTVERFYEPTGRTNQIVGLQPDFPVLIFPGATAADEPVMREEDKYATALPPLGTPWVQPRTREVAAINQCRGSAPQVLDQVAQKRYQELDGTSANGADYRLLVAEEILNCSTGGQNANH